MSASAAEFYGDPRWVQGTNFDYYETSRAAIGSGYDHDRPSQELDFIDQVEVTQAISMGVARQDFRDRTTLRSSGQDFTPTTYGYLGKMGHMIARHRQRGVQPPPETNIYSSRIVDPEPVRIQDIRGWARASVAGALDPRETPYVRSPQGAVQGQVYRTNGRALFDHRHHVRPSVPSQPEGSVVDLTLSFQQEAAAQRLIEAWHDHCDHDKDERTMTRNRRALIGSAAVAAAVLSSSAAWAVYEFILNR